MPESNTPNNKRFEEPSSSMDIDFINRQSRHEIEEVRLCEASRQILNDAGFRSGQLSLAVVDDEEMQQLNRQYLEHDYPTDVLSFLLEDGEDFLEGEVIVSADTAAREARRWNWPVHDELLLYVIHGTLHLIGMDDHEPEDRSQMRQAETHYLAKFGLRHRFEEEVEPAVDAESGGEVRTSSIRGAPDLHGESEVSS